MLRKPRYFPIFSNRFQKIDLKVLTCEQGSSLLPANQYYASRYSGDLWIIPNWCGKLMGFSERNVFGNFWDCSKFKLVIFVSVVAEMFLTLMVLKSTSSKWGLSVNESDSWNNLEGILMSSAPRVYLEYIATLSKWKWPMISSVWN